MTILDLICDIIFVICIAGMLMISARSWYSWFFDASQ